MCQRSEAEIVKLTPGKCTMCIMREARNKGQEAQDIRNRRLEEDRRRAADYEREAVWNEIGGNSTDRILRAQKRRG